MKIIYDEGMVEIKSEHVNYTDIKNMYKGGRSGTSLHVVESLKDRQDEINAICDQIADLVYQLADMEKPNV